MTNNRSSFLDRSEGESHRDTEAQRPTRNLMPLFQLVSSRVARIHKVASAPLCLCGSLSSASRSRRTLGWLFVGLVIAACSLLVPQALGQATPSTRPVSPAEQAQFQQRN